MLLQGQNRLLVLVEEEYGYRYHFLFSAKTPDQLVEWWKGLDSVSGFFYNPAKTMPDSNEEMLTVATEDELEQWMTMLESHVHIHIHVHTDGDSFLRLPDGTFVYHKGNDPHYYDSKPGDRVCLMDPKTGEQVLGYYDDNLNFVADEE
jgi:hypothetical protein